MPSRSFPNIGNSFLSTPSARRATQVSSVALDVTDISIHALREEGDETAGTGHTETEDFYPRPPRGGRLARGGIDQTGLGISIHALREEGDFSRGDFRNPESYFYPRPPRGGRLLSSTMPLSIDWIFLSTPSARRATIMQGRMPPSYLISIHALREEGDHLMA